MSLSYFPINSEKKPLVKNWPQHQGRPVGNYGIALSDEYLVVDIDPRNGGDISEQMLLELNLLKDTKIVTTARGGRHYYYTKPKGVEISKNHNDFPGVDFLSKGRYVVGEGSVIFGKRYVSNTTNINSVAVELLRIINRKPLLEPAIPEKKYETEELQKIIGYLPTKYVDNYDLWLQVGMCLHEATQGSQVGLNLWDTWSARSPKYAIGDTTQKWLSFSTTKDKKVSVGTLIAYAMKEGYTGITGDKLSPLTKNVKQRDTTDYLEDLHNWVYITDQKGFYHLVDKKFYDVDTMRLHYQHVIQNGNPIRVILANPNLIRADGFTYVPGGPEFVEEGAFNVKYNKWTKPKISRKKGDATILEEHIKWLVQDEWEILRDWLAWVIQHPEERCTWAIILTGSYGVGKSYLGELCQKLLGVDNVSYPTNETLHEKYTTWAALKQLVIVQELMAPGRRDIMNKLKQYITEEYVPVREMHRNEYTIKAYFNMLFFSNYENPIVLDPGDRRFCILRVYDEKREPEYYQRLWGWTFKNLDVILDYFLSIDLRNFNPKTPPMTYAKSRLIEELNHGNWVELIEEWVKTQGRTIFTLREAWRVVADIEDDENEIHNAKMLSHLLRHKFQAFKRIRVGKVMESFYVTKNAIHRFKTLSSAQVLHIYKTQLLGETP